MSSDPQKACIISTTNSVKKITEMYQLEISLIYFCFCKLISKNYFNIFCVFIFISWLHIYWLSPHLANILFLFFAHFFHWAYHFHFFLSVSLFHIFFMSIPIFFYVFNVASISFHVFRGFSLLCLVVDVLNFNKDRLWSFFLHCIFLRNFYFYLSFKITSIFFIPSLYVCYGVGLCIYSSLNKDTFVPTPFTGQSAYFPLIWFPNQPLN